MKLALFFLFSAALHAGILAQPVSFHEMAVERIIPVTLLSIGGGDGGPLTPQKQADRSGATSQRRARAARENPRRDLRSDPTFQVAPQVAATAPAVQEEPAHESGALTAAPDKPEGRVALYGGGENNGAVNGNGNGNGGGTGTLENRNSGGSAALGGNRNGGGAGEGSPTRIFTQAAYAHNPRPPYPDRAQREGWEGTVLLRVLVDHAGRAASIEINRSSGFETLDRAAVKTVKDWRFHPARRGERVVESWVRIPIVFKLTERDRGS